MGRLHKTMTSVLVLTALILTGCAAKSREAGEREAVARHLSADAMEYSFISGKALQKSRAGIDRMLDGAVDLAVDPASRRELAAGIFLYRMLFAVSGADAVNCIGRSSEDLGNGFIQERIVVLTDPAKPGLLRDLPGAGTIDPAAMIKELPQGTKVAFSLDIKPVELLKALARCGEYGDRLMSNLPAGLPVNELIKGTDGIWTFTVIDSNVKDPVIRFELPDKEQKIYNLCALLMRQPDALKKGVKRLEFPNVGVVETSGTRLTLYLGGRSEKIFKESKKIDFSGCFGKILSAMPKEAVAAGFLSADALNDDTWRLGKIELPSLIQLKNPEVVTVSRLSGDSGFLILSNGSSTLLSSDLSLFLEVIMPHLKKLGGAEKERAAAPAPKTPAKPVETVKKSGDTGCSCVAVLYTAGAVQKENPALKAGLYKVKDGKLLPAVPAVGDKYDAALFTITGSDPRLPMWISAPHGSGFCVLTADGQCTSFKLAKPESFRRVIGFLHTVYNFDENVFRQLIEAAGEFDRKLRK